MRWVAMDRAADLARNRGDADRGAKGQATARIILAERPEDF